MHERKAAARREELKSSFARLVDYAVNNSVQVVIIAGDLFDTKRASYATAEFVLDEIRRAPEVDFLYLRGNHDGGDKVFRSMDLPDNLKMFSDSWTSYPYEDIVISGYEQTRLNVSRMYSEAAFGEGAFNIVVLHGEISTQRGSNFIDIESFAGKSIDYMALGHIHSYSGLTRFDDRGSYCYSGCLEGRGFDECGEKGFVLLDVRNGSYSMKFVPHSERVLHEVEVDLSSAQGPADVRRLVKESTKDIAHSDMVKVVLRGELDAGVSRDFSYLQSELERTFFFSKVKDKCVLSIDSDEYMHDISLKGEFARMVMASSLDHEMKDMVLRAGLQALRGEEVEL